MYFGLLRKLCDFVIVKIAHELSHDFKGKGKAKNGK